MTEIPDKNSTQKSSRRRTIRTLTLLLFIAILSVLLIIFKQRSIENPVVPMREDVKQKLIVLGFDGMDARWTEKWMNEGKLPNLAKLRDQGCFRYMQSTIPPESPVSWSSILTGMNPGKTNIYDFLRRDYEYKILPSWAKVTPMKFAFNYMPISKPKFENLRDGDPMWVVSTRNGIKTTVFQAPISFPLEKTPGSKSTPGLGVPDIKGTQATYSFYVDDMEVISKYAQSFAKEGRQTEFGGQIKEVIILPGDTINDYIYGPRNSITQQDIKVEFELTFDRKARNATITIQDQTQTIEEGKWSDWFEVNFRTNNLISLDGIFMIYMMEIPGLDKEGTSTGNFKMYITPINFDPAKPPKVLDLSYPRTYSADLVKEIGTRYWTQGWAEDTMAFNDEIIDHKAFLEMTDMVETRREKIVWNELKKNDWNLFIGVFQATDRIQHMFMRLLDEEHPRYDPEEVKLFGDQVLKCYQRADEFVGRVMDEIVDENTTFVVISDHGFAFFRRAVNLNRILMNNGYLVPLPEFQKNAENARNLEDFFEGDKSQFFSYVDWTKTKAYALGLGQIYLNMEGREVQGIVKPGEEEARIKKEITDLLLSIRDPEYDNAVVFKNIYDGKEIYHGNHMDQAPDLCVGMASGYRISWQTCLGGAPTDELEFNDRRWGADHCAFDPSETPAIIFANKMIDNESPHLYDIAPSVYKFFDIPISEEVDGKPFTFVRGSHMFAEGEEKAGE
jgi:predicted AlkP superfamily phosphohydrolase/phosphomutase